VSVCDLDCLWQVGLTRSPECPADLNAWAPSGQNPSATPPNRVGNQGYLAGQDPSFWTSSYGADGEHRMAWTGYIQIDKVSYQWLGNSFGKTIRAGKNARQIAMTYTATRTIYQFEADSVLFNVTFMTPIWPHDYLRQSESKVEREEAKGASDGSNPDNIRCPFTRRHSSQLHAL
jgi:hypothetical protein